MTAAKKLTAKQRTVPMFDGTMMGKQEDRTPPRSIDGPPVFVVHLLTRSGLNKHLAMRGESASLCGASRKYEDAPSAGMGRCQACWAEASRIHAIVRSGKP